VAVAQQLAALAAQRAEGVRDAAPSRTTGTRGQVPLETDAVAERVIGTLRRECFDHVVPVDERHLGAIRAAYGACDNRDHPHRTLRIETPRP
jgi:hypothetical protein